MGEQRSATHNLPHPLARFVGREEEIPELRKLLAGTRLLTLTGIGGSGKTRLAIEIASRSLADFPQGIWLVELSELSEPHLVQQSIAASLGLHQDPDKPLTETLIAALKPKRLLLVVDNCEHLIDACAHIAQTLLISCPQLRILATSREPLRVPGETSWQVLPLSLPNSDLPISPQEALQYAAIQLFIDRAQSILPTFSISQENVLDTVRVCRRLEGIPLALELAAAWVNVLSIAQINENLAHSLRFLVRGSRTSPARQQTLRATLDWSHDLLSDKEKTLFRRLAFFVSDFSLSAAESVCSGAGLERDEVLALLSQLVNKSLLLVQQKEDQEKRFQQLEIVRQYSLEKLSTSQEEERVADRFLEYYLAISEKSASQLVGSEQGKWVTILEQELSHLRTALRLSLEQPARVEKGLRLASALAQFWQLRGYLSEGSKWLEELLARSSGEPDRVRAQALSAARFLAFFLEDYDRSTGLGEEAREIYQQLGDDAALAAVIDDLAFTALALGDYERANSLAEQSLAMLKEKEIDDPMLAASVLFCIGDVAFFRKDLTRAVSSLQESLQLCREMGNPWATARRLARLGELTSIQGDPGQAVEYLDEGLAMARDAGDKWGMVMNLTGLAEVTRRLGRMERAARLLAASQAISEFFSAHRRPVDRHIYESAESAVKAELGEQVYQAICLETRSQTLEQVVEYALAGPDRLHPGSLAEARVPPVSSMTPRQELKAKYGGLTAREREVAALVAQGKSNASIAAELFVGVRTVEAHITRILTKLNFTSRAQIAGWAIHKGLAPPPR